MGTGMGVAGVARASNPSGVEAWVNSVCKSGTSLIQSGPVFLYYSLSLQVLLVYLSTIVVWHCESLPCPHPVPVPWTTKNNDIGCLMFGCHIANGNMASGCKGRRVGVSCVCTVQATGQVEIGCLLNGCQ